MHIVDESLLPAGREVAFVDSNDDVEKPFSVTDVRTMLDTIHSTEVFGLYFYVYRTPVAGVSQKLCTLSASHYSHPDELNVPLNCFIDCRLESCHRSLFR